jgi:hypothetical protein
MAILEVWLSIEVTKRGLFSFFDRTDYELVHDLNSKGLNMGRLINDPDS